MDYSEREAICEATFQQSGPYWHLWTPENFNLIFIGESDLKAGMNIIGICAKLFPRLTILTFEIMSNHFHFTICGAEDDLISFFARFKRMLKSYFAGKSLNWSSFYEKHRELSTVDEVRNVIVYNNRNGFVISRIYTPFTYPWGANRYYFNPDAKQLAILNSKEIHVRERRIFSRANDIDGIKGLLKYGDCALPLSFCDITLGEKLFRTPVQYFNKVSKSIESSAKIAHEIGENIYYTDDDLFASIISICRKKFDKASPNILSPEEKIDIAKTIRHEYNASVKQIQRMLKLDSGTLAAIGIN